MPLCRVPVQDAVVSLRLTQQAVAPRLGCRRRLGGAAALAMQEGFGALGGRCWWVEGLSCGGPAGGATAALLLLYR